MKMVVNKPSPTKKSSTSLSPMPDNAEEAIAAALLASRVYGGSSSEAKYAWDLVEEFDEARRCVLTDAKRDIITVLF